MRHSADTVGHGGMGMSAGPAATAASVTADSVTAAYGTLVRLASVTNG